MADEHSTCAVDGCGKPVYGNGYCRPHNRRRKLYGDPLATPYFPRLDKEVIGGVPHKRCSGCMKMKPEGDYWVVNGYVASSCKTCQSAKRKRHYESIKRFNCSVPGCTRGVVSKKLGLCAMHRSRFKANGDLGPAQSLGELNQGPCKVPGCKGRVTSKQLCQTHYNRLLKYGDPLGVSEWTQKRRDKRAIREGYRGSGGYWFIHRNGGRIAEHRYVMEQRLGRKLRPNENVHHINGKRDDNRPENLELWVSSQPSGQRPEDLVKWAREFLALYGEEVERAKG